MIRNSNAPKKSLGQRLKAGLAEGLQHAAGQLTLRTITVPSPPPTLSAADVQAMRTRSGMSQAVFARVLNVSTKTVQSWEQGERTPSHASLRILQIFQRRPDAVCEVAGVETSVG